MIKLKNENINKIGKFEGEITNFKSLMEKYQNDEVTMGIYLNFFIYILSASFHVYTWRVDPSVLTRWVVLHRILGRIIKIFHKLGERF